MAASNAPTYSPIQIQKLFFLIDRNISDLVGGPFFDFQPYLYGPYDSDLYEELDRLTIDGLVKRTVSGRLRSYTITESGSSIGKTLLSSMNPHAREYMTNATQFVQTLTFKQLVTAIYKAYPDMKVNSIFA